MSEGSLNENQLSVRETVRSLKAMLNEAERKPQVVAARPVMQVTSQEEIHIAKPHEFGPNLDVPTFLRAPARPRPVPEPAMVPETDLKERRPNLELRVPPGVPVETEKTLKELTNDELTASLGTLLAKEEYRERFTSLMTQRVADEKDRITPAAKTYIERATDELFGADLSKRDNAIVKIFAFADSISGSARITEPSLRRKLGEVLHSWDETKPADASLWIAKPISGVDRDNNLKNGAALMSEKLRRMMVKNRQSRTRPVVPIPPPLMQIPEQPATVVTSDVPGFMKKLYGEEGRGVLDKPIEVRDDNSSIRENFERVDVLNSLREMSPYPEVRAKVEEAVGILRRAGQGVTQAEVSNAALTIVALWDMRSYDPIDRTVGELEMTRSLVKGFQTLDIERQVEKLKYTSIEKAIASALHIVNSLVASNPRK